MRKVLITLLLASAAASPALAARPDNSDRDDRRAERQESRAERQSERQSAREERSERSSNSDRVEYSRPERNERQVQVRQPAERPAQIQQVDRRAVRDIEALRQRDDRGQSEQALRLQRRDNRDDRVEAFRERRDDRAEAIRDRREVREMRTSRPVVSTTPRFGTQPPLRVERNRSPVKWSSNWRHDGKYDWRSHRNRHRSLFHLGFYYDPFGWGYQRYSIGWRLWPSYYRSSFWLNDPWMYRLPYAPPGTRWIRYYDDAILVDMWSGQVVDVIYDFFW